MAKLVKGTFDILPFGQKILWQSSSVWQQIENTIRSLCEVYNYHEIRTPIFEYEEVFYQGIGDTSDIVTKEMYSFFDKKNRKLVLRPEGTAAVLRAIADRQLYKENNKLFYIEPMFRYERPQQGRYRQHHQFGAEAIGKRDPYQDAELMDLLFSFCSKVGFDDIIVKLNTIGDLKCRRAFSKDLVSYLTPYKNDLSVESQQRLETNVLRILDSKSPQDHKLLKEAPNIHDYLSSEDKEYFQDLCAILEMIGIPYRIDNFIVRGLDYYNGTVFEVFSSNGKIALGGGGRYDGFTEQFGMPSLAAAGFSVGLERILQGLLENEKLKIRNKSPKLFLAVFEDKEKFFAIATELRRLGISTEFAFNLKKIGDAFSLANKLGVKYAAVYASKEKENKSVTVKNMEKRSSEVIALKDFVNAIKERER